MSKEHRQQHHPVSLRALPRMTVVREIARKSLRDDVVGLSAELAFRSFLAVFPFFVFVTALGGLIAAELPIRNPAKQAVELIGDALPPEGTGYLQQQLEQIIDNASRRQLIIGGVLALLFATSVTNALIKALNRAYDVGEHRPMWKRYAIAMVLTVIAGMGTVLAFVLFVPLRLLAPWIAEGLDLGDSLPLVLNVLALAAALALLALAATLLYRLGPSIKLPLRVVLPGAVMFALGWLAATFLFGFYVWNLANYASTYGALAGVVIILIWFYVLAAVLLVSAEANQVLHEMTDPADVEARRRQAEAEGRSDWRPSRDLGLPSSDEEDAERGAAGG